MKKIGLIIIAAFLCSCGLFNDENALKKNSDPFELNTLRSFKGDTITYVGVDKSDNIFVATTNEWLMSQDFGETFTTFEQPDTIHFQRIELLDNTFYGIGVVEIEYNVWGDSSITSTAQSNILYKSENGLSWEKILGPFLMTDLLLDKNNHLHISKYNGVSSIDLSTDTEYLNEFLFTKSVDFIRQMDIASNGDVYAVSHDGIYKTADSGKNWNRISQEIPKNLDDISRIKIIDEVTFLAQGTRRVYSSENGEDWEWFDMYYSAPSLTDKNTLRRDTFYPNGFTISNNGFLYASDSYGLFVAKPDSIFEFKLAGPEGYDFENPFPYNIIFSLSNGDLILVNNNVITYANKNTDSEFWN